WHKPAVPPLESASHPGEKISVHPSGMCGVAGGCCGGPCCSATTSSAACFSIRSALELIDVRCFIELLQISGVARGQLAVNAKTGVGPAANPFAIVQIGLRRIA